MSKQKADPKKVLITLFVLLLLSHNTYLHYQISKSNREINKKIRVIKSDIDVAVEIAEDAKSKADESFIYAEDALNMAEEVYNNHY